MYTLGDKIHKLRKQAGFSQEELAFRVDVTRQTVSLWESNNLVPKSDKLKLLCQIFNVSSDYFLFDDEIKNTTENNTTVIDSTKDEYVNLKSNYTVTNKSKNKRKIVKIVSAVLIIILLLLIIVICFMFLNTPTDGVGQVNGISFNSYTLLILAIIIGCLFIFIGSMILVIYLIKKLKK